MSNFDIYQEVTDRIIAEMEKGIIPWHKAEKAINLIMNVNDEG